jgi:hypothetical protein
MQILTALTAIVLCMPSCSLSRSKQSPVRPLDLAVEKLDFDAQITVDGPVIRFLTSNREELIWLVVEDPIPVDDDGFFLGERFSAISGSYVGTTMHAIGQAFLLPPGDTKSSTVDLNKNYENLNLSESRLPKSSSLGIAAFDSAEAASKFLAYLKTRDIRDKTRANLFPYPYYYESIWRYKTP